jgi:hypothetical protein
VPATEEVEAEFSTLKTPLGCAPQTTFGGARDPNGVGRFADIASLPLGGASAGLWADGCCSAKTLSDHFH